MLDRFRNRCLITGLYFLGIPMVAGSLLLTALGVRIFGMDPNIFAYLQGWLLFSLCIYLGIVFCDYSKAFNDNRSAIITFLSLILLGLIYPLLLHQLLMNKEWTAHWPIISLSGLVVMICCHLMAVILLIQSLFKSLFIRLWNTKYRTHLLAHAPFVLWTTAWACLNFIQGQYINLFGSNLGLNSEMTAIALPYYVLGWLCCAFNVPIFWMGLTLGLYDSPAKA